MKFTLLINQAGVVRCGLLGRVNVFGLCVLDYIGGWFFCAKARRVVVEGREFVWLRYEHAVEELPLLFNPQATVETRKNQLSRLVRGLRDAGLVESVKVGRDLYLRPSDLATSISTSREKTVTKSAPTITPAHDETVTSSHDDTIMPTQDDSGPTNIDQTTIKQTNISETTPHSPPKGETVKGTPVPMSQLKEKQAEEIYSAYPKKVGKPAALRAIRRALKTKSADFLLERTKLFATTYNGEARFIPHPATWFNGARYNDDPGTWCHSTPTNGKHQPKIISLDSFSNRIGKL